MAYYLPWRKQPPTLMFNHFQNNQAAIVNAIGPGGKRLPPPETPFEPACSSANKIAVPKECGVPQSESCGAIATHNEPYFTPRIGFRKTKRSSSQIALLLNKTRRQRSSM